MHDNIPQDPFSGPDEAIAQACIHLQEQDMDISIRAVAARLGISHTTISRNAMRCNQVERCAALQQHARQIAVGNSKKRRNAADLENAKLKMQIAELEAQVQILTASHKAMIFAVGESGGMEAWKKFYDSYQGSMDRLPVPDNVTEIIND